MNGCLFCAIVAGELPAALVAEEPRAIAFLDVHPLFFGHTLVVPRAHATDLSDLPAEDVAPVFGLAQRVALAQERGLGAHGTFLAVNHRVSQSVPHLHVHVVPRHKGDGLKGFFWPRKKYASSEQTEATAATLRAALGSV